MPTKGQFKTAVSTHSRPKAAGRKTALPFQLFNSFNTQPPEGGWTACPSILIKLNSFNTQPPEGGWMRIVGEMPQ